MSKEGKLRLDIFLFDENLGKGRLRLDIACFLMKIEGRSTEVELCLLRIKATTKDKTPSLTEPLTALKCVVQGKEMRGT